MKSLYSLIIALLFYCGSPAQVRGSIMDINSHTVGLDSLSGKKILIILLPLQRDTAVINQLIRFQNKYGQQVKIIALAYGEKGKPDAAGIRSMYGAIADAGIILSEGVQAGDSAITQRESVLQWLSAKNRNRPTEPFAAGSKYFLSEDGRLFAQVGKGTSLDSRMVSNIIKTQVPGEAMNRRDSLPKRLQIN